MTTLQARSLTRRDPAATRPARTRVVAGVDSSPASMAAVEWAVAEAGLRGAALHIVHAWTWHGLAPWETDADRAAVADLKRAGHRVVDHCAAMARRSAPGLTVTTEVRQGPPARVLVELTRTAALAVVGTHHLQRLGRTILGSTSGSLVAQATCPTLVVSPSAHRTALSQAPPPRGLVVGIGATPEDQQLLAFAFSFAEQHNIPLRVLYGWHPDGLADNELPPPTVALDWLSQSIAGWRSDHPDVAVSAAVQRGHPVSVLVAAAGPDDLLVVGRRTRRQRLGRHLGSVSLGVLHHATGSVAVVPFSYAEPREA